VFSLLGVVVDAPFGVEYLMRKQNYRWWSKFNYVLSAALDSGELECGWCEFLELNVYAFPRHSHLAHLHILCDTTPERRQRVCQLVGEQRLREQ
jgi:hypothetical protein